MLRMLRSNPETPNYWHQVFDAGNPVFAVFFSFFSRRFSLMLFFGAFTSFFGDFSPIAETLLPDKVTHTTHCQDSTS
jgi:hypothetical protein